MLFGVALTSALAAGVIMAAIPAAVALLSRLFLRERITGALPPASPARSPASRWSRSRATTAQPGGGSLWGNLLLLGAVLCEASYVVIGKQLTGNVSPKRISALINLWGLALVTPLRALAGAQLRLQRGSSGIVVAAALLFAWPPAWSRCGSG